MSNFGTLNMYKTKKALQQDVAAGNPVMVYDTSLFPNNRGIISITELQPMDVIVGPDPYRNRKWYANYRNEKIV